MAWPCYSLLLHRPAAINTELLSRILETKRTGARMGAKQVFIVHSNAMHGHGCMYGTINANAELFMSSDIRTKY